MELTCPLCVIYSDKILTLISARGWGTHISHTWKLYRHVDLEQLHITYDGKKLIVQSFYETKEEITLSRRIR